MAITVADNKLSFLKDGKPFFYLADTCWSAFTNMKEADWEYYLQYRKRQGYNVLQINILPQWDASATDLQHYPYICNEEGVYQFDQINDSYFTHAREMCIRAKEYGFELALVVLWCNYVPATWANNMLSKQTMPFDQIENYITKVDQTFSDLEPVYMISGDTDLDNEITRKYYIEASDSLRKKAPTSLQTLHVRGRLMEIQKALLDRMDFYMYQSGHNALPENLCMPYRIAEYFIKNYPTKPLLNSEPCYEQMGSSGGKYGRFHEFDIRRAAWQSLLSGATAGITYGAAGIYSWHTYGKEFEENIGEGFDSPNPWHLALHYPGAWDYSDIRAILSNLSIEALYPKQDVVLNSTEEIRAAATKDEKILLVYVPENTTLRLNLDFQPLDNQVTIIDLETRHQEQANCYYEGETCSIKMHLFGHDALYVIKK